MKHKSNPWLSLIALLLMAVLIVCICTGCAPDVPRGPEGRFVVEEVQPLPVDMIGQDREAIIIRDTETDVRYLCITGNYFSGITVLEEAPGEEADR